MGRGGHKKEEVTKRKRTQGGEGRREGRTRGEGRGRGDVSLGQEPLNYPPSREWPPPHPQDREEVPQ